MCNKWQNIIEQLPAYICHVVEAFFLGGGYKDLQYLNHQKGLTLEGLSKAFKHIQTTEIKRCGTKAPQGDPGINSPLATTICFFCYKDLQCILRGTPGSVAVLGILFRVFLRKHKLHNLISF